MSIALRFIEDYNLFFFLIIPSLSSFLFWLVAGYKWTVTEDYLSRLLLCLPVHPLCIPAPTGCHHSWTVLASLKNVNSAQSEGMVHVARNVN